MTETEMFRFETANFIVRATIEPDEDLDLSWDEDGETCSKLVSGEYEAFGTVVTVRTRSGTLLAETSLWGSIYAKPADFFSAHRDPNPMNRNCMAMREARSSSAVICHYFPSLVSEAISDARKALATLPKLRTI